MKRDWQDEKGAVLFAFDIAGGRSSRSSKKIETVYFRYDCFEGRYDVGKI